MNEVQDRFDVNISELPDEIDLSSYSKSTHHHQSIETWFNLFLRFFSQSKDDKRQPWNIRMGRNTHLISTLQLKLNSQQNTLMLWTKQNRRHYSTETSVSVFSRHRLSFSITCTWLAKQLIAISFFLLSPQISSCI